MDKIRVGRVNQALGMLCKRVCLPTIIHFCKFPRIIVTNTVFKQTEMLQLAEKTLSLVHN